MRGLFCGNQFNRFGTFGAFGFAYGNHAFFFTNGGGAGFVGFGFGFGFGTRFFSNGDGAVLLGQFDGFAALNLCLFNGLGFSNVFVFNVAFGGNAFQIHFAFCGNFRFFRFTFFLGFLFGDAGFLFSTAYRNFTLLFEFGVFFFARDFQALLLGFKIFGFNCQVGVLFDFVTFFAAAFDGFGQFGQTFRVKGILRVEKLKAGLIEAGQGNGFEFETVFEQVFTHDLLHLLNEINTFFMQLFHCHFSGNGAQGVDEFTFDEVFQFVGRHGFHTQRLRGGGDALRAGFDADVKLCHHIDAHPVAGNQRLLRRAAHFKAQCVHVDGDDFVQHGQHHRTAVHDDFFAAEAGTDEGDFFAGAAVQAGENKAEYEQRNEYDAGDDADGN